jgi:hypothetical protein
MDIQFAHSILGLHPGSTAIQIKKAYRKLIADWHPDRFPDDKRKHAFAEGFSKDLNNARDFLLANIPENQHQAVIPLSMALDSRMLQNISQFIAEVFTKDEPLGTTFVDLNFVYHLYCCERETEQLSLLQFYSCLVSLGFIATQYTGISQLLSLFLNGLTINDEWKKKIEAELCLISPMYESDEFTTEYQNYSEMDSDDDLGEVVF